MPRRRKRKPLAAPSLPPSFTAFAAQMTALLAADQPHQGDTEPLITSMQAILDRQASSLPESALSVLLSRLPPPQQPPSPQRTLQLSLPDYLFKGDPSTGLAPALERCKWDSSKYRYKTNWYRDLRALAAEDGMGDIDLDTIKTRISERKDT